MEHRILEKMGFIFIAVNAYNVIRISAPHKHGRKTVQLDFRQRRSQMHRLSLLDKALDHRRIDRPV